MRYLQYFKYVVFLSMCGGITGAYAQLKYSGSDTLEPLVAAANVAYVRGHPGFKLNLNATGSSAGLREFCAGKTMFAGSSRTSNQTEVKDCDAKGVRYTELTAAADAIALVVSTKNGFAKDLTLAEIKRIFEPAAAGKLTSWKQVRPSFPDQPLLAVGVGVKHGTFGFFHSAIGNSNFTRSDMKDTPEHDETVKIVSANVGAIGYVPLAVAKDFSAQVSKLKIDFGNGPVEPTQASIADGKYGELSRMTYFYINLPQLQAAGGDAEGFVRELVVNMDRYVGFANMVPVSSLLYQENIRRTSFKRN